MRRYVTNGVGSGGDYLSVRSAFGPNNPVVPAAATASNAGRIRAGHGMHQYLGRAG
jgi:hypothetical protein